MATLRKRWEIEEQLRQLVSSSDCNALYEVACHIEKNVEKCPSKDAEDAELQLYDFIVDFMREKQPQSQEDEGMARLQTVQDFLHKQRQGQDEGRSPTQGEDQQRQGQDEGRSPTQSEDQGPSWKPFKKKCCTDIPWLIVFLLFCFGMVFNGTIAFSCGSFSKLVSGYDSFGNMCGKRNSHIAGIPLSGRDQTQNKYVFTLDPCNIDLVHRKNKSMALCVSKCPDVQLNSSKDLKNFAEQSGSYLCSYDLPLEQYTTSPDNATKCPTLPVRKSTSWSWLFNHCAPPLVCYTNALKSLMADSEDSIFPLFNEFVTSIETIVGLCLLALVLSYLLAVFFRYLNYSSPCITFFLFIGTVGGTTCLWLLYGFSQKALIVTLGQNILEDTKAQIHNLLIYAIIATVFTVILWILMIFVFYRRVHMKNTFSLFELAGEVFKQMCLIFFQFVWTILFIFFFVFWTAVMVFLSTVGNPVKNNETGFLEFHIPTWVKILMFCHTISLIWFINFFLACQQMIVAKAVATYYFRVQNEMSCCSLTMKNWPICAAICHVICYHLGTATIGALTIPLAKVPSLILLYIHKQSRETNCYENTKKICLCSPLYLNLNAYTATVINSSNLFQSGLDAFKTLENAQGMASVEHLADVVVLLGKKLVVFCTAFAGVSTVIIHHKYVIPLLVFIIICLLAFLVVHSILSIFVIVIDVILLCYAYDITNKENGREYFGSDHFINGMKSLKNELIDLGQLNVTTERS